MVYAVGSVALTVGAIPTLHLPAAEVTVLGLMLIAIGTGGIKPNVSAFGGDQFKLPEQAKHLATFFSLFYLSINAGSMISTLLTPILRADVHCFGELNCYSLAFGVPGALMIVSICKFTSLSLFALFATHLSDHSFFIPSVALLNINIDLGLRIWLRFSVLLLFFDDSSDQSTTA